MSLKSDKISLQWRRLVEVILLFLFPSFRPGTFSGIIYFRQDRVVVIDVAGDTREEFRTPASHVEELFSVSRVERTNVVHKEDDAICFHFISTRSSERLNKAPSR